LHQQVIGAAGSGMSVFQKGRPLLCGIGLVHNDPADNLNLHLGLLFTTFELYSSQPIQKIRLILDKKNKKFQRK